MSNYEQCVIRRSIEIQKTKIIYLIRVCSPSQNALLKYILFKMYTNKSSFSD